MNHSESKSPSAAQPEKKDRSRLRLKKGAALNSRACPHCQAVMGAEDVVCVQCGYNLHTGTVMQTRTVPQKKRPRRRFPLKRVLCWSLLIAGAAWCGMHPAETRAFYQNQVLPFYQSRVLPLYEEHVAPLINRTENPYADQVKQEDRMVQQALKASSPDKIREELNQGLPLLMPGEKAVFTNLKGQSAECTYLGMQGDRVVLKLENGAIVKDAAEKLTETCRLRCDPAFREEYIQQQID